MKFLSFVFILLTLSFFNLYSFTEYFDNTWTNTGTSVIYQSPAGVGMNFNMPRIRINDVIINNNLMHRIIIPEIYGPAEPGKQKRSYWTDCCFTPMGRYKRSFSRRH